MADIEMNGTTVQIVTELELNGDPMDCVQIDRILKLDLEDKPG
jgi:hypothetical protein